MEGARNLARRLAAADRIGGGQAMEGARNTGKRPGTRGVLTAAIAIAVCLPAATLLAEHQNGQRPAHNSAPRQETRPQYTRPQSPQQQNQHPAQQYPQYRPPAGMQPQRPAQNPYTQAPRGVYPTPNYNTQGSVHRALPGTAQQLYAPPGHLGAWLNTHRDVPVQQQQRMLQSDPSFRRLPQGEQQRVMNQLNQVNRLPDAQRERRLARAENLERLSPEDRARVNQSARRWTTLPPDRQAMMRNAFRDLKSVPLDQRAIVLNSSRYQNQFSPEERGILSDMLCVEPYAPPQ